MKLIDSSLPRFLLVGVGNTLLSAVLMFALEGLGYAFGTGLMFYLASLILAPAYDRCASQDAPACFRGLPAALLTIAVLSLAFLGFTGGKIF